MVHLSNPRDAQTVWITCVHSPPSQIPGHRAGLHFPDVQLCSPISFPKDGADTAQVLWDRHWRAFLSRGAAGTVPDSLPEASGLGAALWPFGIDEQLCASSIPLPALPAQLRDWPQFMLMS